MHNNIVKKIHNKIRSYMTKSVGYSGNYASFKIANDVISKHFSNGGYDAETIFKKVSYATLKVLNGEAAFERDSFLFYKKEINYNLMMYFYRFFISDTKLNVLDFGGACGSTYLQHRSELETLNTKWVVTEQKHFVEFAKKNIILKNLSFMYNEELENKWDDFTVVLLSGVLQYIENAKKIIADILSHKIRHIVIERTPVSDHNRYWIETVHEPIYEAVYPCCVFEEKDFVRQFTDKGYELIDSWKSLVDGDVHVDKKTIEFKSFVFELK